MTTAASLLVRIGADVEDFTRGMTKAEKAAKRGFQEIGEAAATMTEFFSVEFAAAALEFAHLAANAQDASARMDRVFGGAAGDMKENLEQLTHSIPESVAQMQTLAVQSNNMLQGLGYGADKAASMSVEMVKLAGDMAAFAHVPVADPLDALDRGLAGKTRGLIQFGIVVNQAAIHQEAMRRGLVDEHRTLTELGTAEIAHSLILKAATRIQGEAERTAGQASNSFKFLKVAVEEMGVSIGRLTIPAVAGLTKKMTEMADAIEHTSDTKKDIVLWGGALVAAIGPAILLVARFAKELIALRRAQEMFAAGEGTAAVLGGLSAAPILAIAGAFTLLATAGTLAYKATQNVMRELNGGQLDSEKADDDEQAQKDRVRGALIHHAHRLAAKPGLPTSPPPKLSDDVRSPLEKFRTSQSQANGLFDNALATGASNLAAMYERLAGARAQALNAMHNEGQSDIEFFLAAAEAYEKARQKIAAFDLGKDIKIGTITAGGIHAESVRRMSDDAVRSKLADTAVGSEDALRMREEALKMKDLFNAPREASAQMGEQMRNTKHDLDVRAVMLTLADTFDATREATIRMGEQIRNNKHDLAERAASLTLADGFNATAEAVVAMGEQIRKTNNDLDFRAAALKLADGFDAAKTAAVELGEHLRRVKNDFATAVASFKQQWSGKSDIVASAGAGLKEGAMQIMSMFTPAGLAAAALGKVMQGLQPVIDKLMGPLVALGQIIAIIAKPLMVPLFEALKMLGISTALVGEVLYSVAGGIAKVVGGLISAIGSFIRKIPFLGGVGKDIQSFGDGIQNLGKSFFQTADDLDTARRQLQDLNFDDAANGLNSLTDAAKAAASQMLNVPQGFKAALAQFDALSPKGPHAAPTGPANYSVSSGAGMSTSGGDIPVVLVLDGEVVARSTLRQFKRKAQAQFGDSTRWAEVMA